MIKSILHLFKIHRKVVLGHAPVVVQDVLGVAPKTFNAVNVVLAAVGKGTAVVEAVVLAMALERVVAAEGVGVVHRAFARVLANVRHQLLGRHLLHHFGVDTSLAFQEAQHDAFSGSAATTLTLASAAKVGVINFNFARKLRAFQFRHMVDGFTQAVIDTAHCLVVHTQVAGDAVRRLLLVKAGNDGDLPPQLLARLLALAAVALHVSASGLAYLNAPQNTHFLPLKKLAAQLKTFFCRIT